MLGNQLEVRNSGYVYWNRDVLRPRPGGLRHVPAASRAGAGDQDLLLKVNGAAPDGGTGGTSLSAIEVHYDASRGLVLVQTAVPYTPTRPSWVVHHSFPLRCGTGTSSGRGRWRTGRCWSTATARWSGGPT